MHRVRSRKAHNAGLSRDPSDGLEPSTPPYHVPSRCRVWLPLVAKLLQIRTVRACRFATVRHRSRPLVSRSVPLQVAGVFATWQLHGGQLRGSQAVAEDRLERGGVDRLRRVHEQALLFQRALDDRRYVVLLVADLGDRRRCANVAHQLQERPRKVVAAVDQPGRLAAAVGGCVGDERNDAGAVTATARP